MSDESVTREALRWALGRGCADADDALLQAARAWLEGDWQDCADWLLIEATMGGELRYPASTAAALLRIAYSAPGMREAWLAGLPAADAAAVRAETEADR